MGFTQTGKRGKQVAGTPTPHEAKREHAEGLGWRRCAANLLRCCRTLEPRAQRQETSNLQTVGGQYFASRLSRRVPKLWWTTCGM